MPVSVGPKAKTVQSEHETTIQSRQLFCRVVQLGVEAVVGRSACIPLEWLSQPRFRSRDVIFARHLAIYFATCEGRLTLSEAGALFSRDRRSAAYANSLIEARRDADASFDHAVMLLARQVRVAIAHVASRAAIMSGD